MRKTIDLFKSQVFGMGNDIGEDLISTVKVDYHHQSTPLSHLGLVSQQGRRVSITPYEQIMVGVVEEELKKQGFSAYKFSKTTVVVNIPPDSGENRHKVLLQIKKLAEEAKVSIRSIRKKFRKKNPDCDTQLQKITDAATQEIDKMT